MKKRASRQTHAPIGHKMAFGAVSFSLHCLLQLFFAGLIDTLDPGCCWAYPAFSVQHSGVSA